MTDTVTFYRLIIAQVNQFVQAYENLLLISDRISADSALSTKLAASANAGGRTDLIVANFDNLNLAVQQLQAFLNSVNAQVPTGGELKLAFYQVI